jgi:ankyrin repeat protein
MNHAMGEHVDVFAEQEHWTPLHKAVMQGDQHEVEGLLSGNSIHALDRRGRIPLHTAVFWRRQEVAKLLLEHGSDVNFHDYSGWTPLHVAARKGDKIIGLMLLHKGANINDQSAMWEDSQLYTPLGLVVDKTRTIEWGIGQDYSQQMT